MRSYLGAMLAVVILSGCTQRNHAPANAKQNDDPAKIAQDKELAVFERIKNIRGNAKWDETQPGNPIIDVDLSGSEMTDADLKELKELKQPKDAEPLYTGVTEEGLKAMKELFVSNALDLSSIELMDAGMQNLKELKQLTSLNLSGTKVTDAGLMNLKELKQLEFLDLEDTEVTGTGLMNLKVNNSSF